MYCLQETYFEYKDTHSLKVKRWKKIFHINSNQESSMGIHISEKIDFKNCYERPRRPLYIDKRANSSRRHNKYKDIFTKQESPNYEANTERTEGRSTYSATVMTGDFNSLHAD